MAAAAAPTPTAAPTANCASDTTTQMAAVAFPIRRFNFLPVIPAKAGTYALRWTPVFAGATGPHLKHLKGNTANRGGRQRFQSGGLIFFPVIPAKAGIYALRWTPVFARATAPHLNHTKGNTANRGGRQRFQSGGFNFFPSFQFSPSFRRKPESTRCDGLRFSPERRIHT